MGMAGKGKLIVYRVPRKELVTAGMFLVISLLLLVIAGPLSYMVSTGGELHGYLILVDPGHGGIDGGVSRNQVMEKDVNLSVALKLRKYLKEEGARVILTRYRDSDISGEIPPGLESRYKRDLAARIKKINTYQPDFFISLHVNSVAASYVRGAICFYDETSEKSETLAGSLQKRLNEVTGKNLRDGELLHRDTRPGSRLRLLNSTNPPGVLIEMGFITNPRERELFNDKSHREDLARAMRHGIIDYLVWGVEDSPG